jgi:hypothetical protein
MFTTGRGKREQARGAVGMVTKPFGIGNRLLTDQDKKRWATRSSRARGLITTQHLHRIQPRGAPGRNESRKQSSRNEQGQSGKEDREVTLGDMVE